MIECTMRSGPSNRHHTGDEGVDLAVQAGSTPHHDNPCNYEKDQVSPIISACAHLPSQWLHCAHASPQAQPVRPPLLQPVRGETRNPLFPRPR
eukprot:jgi/Mesvir1/26436/Mv25602-RA.1